MLFPALVSAQEIQTINEKTSSETIAERTDSSNENIPLEAIEISFLGSYYQQDGDHSPVTGGVGTEKLNCKAPSIVVNIPIDSSTRFTLDGGVDMYSSASSDNIDNPFVMADHISSASKSDTRVHAIIGLTKKTTSKRRTNEYNIGFSKEHDVFSFSGGFGWAKTTKDNNRQLLISGNIYYDLWKRIYPIEHRNGTIEHLSNNSRKTLNLSISYSAVINKRLQGSITTELVYQTGLISTPFHRVYIGKPEKLINYLDSEIERLPNTRVKFPIGFRLNYYASDLFILRSFYRQYFDNFGIVGSTIKLEIPLKLIKRFTLYPFYRYHTQTGTDYFKEFGMHSSNSAYYTSDYDLSAFQSNKMGVGINYLPLYGISRFRFLKVLKRNMWVIQGIDARIAHYKRSDGLEASILSIGIKIRIR